jgi:hypothetical protein
LPIAKYLEGSNPLVARFYSELLDSVELTERHLSAGLTELEANAFKPAFREIPETEKSEFGVLGLCESGCGRLEWRRGVRLAVNRLLGFYHYFHS